MDILWSVLLVLLTVIIVYFGEKQHRKHETEKMHRRAFMTPEQRARDEEWDRIPGDW